LTTILKVKKSLSEARLIYCPFHHQKLNDLYYQRESRFLRQPRSEQSISAPRPIASWPASNSKCWIYVPKYPKAASQRTRRWQMHWTLAHVPLEVSWESIHSAHSLYHAIEWLQAMDL
jgi:hypothetical protein